MKKALKWGIPSVIVLLVGFISVIICCVCFGLNIPSYLLQTINQKTDPNSVTNIVDKFMEDLVSQDYESAYELFTPELQTNVKEPNNIPSWIGITSKIESYELGALLGDKNNSRYGVGIVFEDGTKGTFWITCVLIEEKYYISKISYAPKK
jgi:hypothetical protein